MAQACKMMQHDSDYNSNRMTVYDFDANSGSWPIVQKVSFLVHTHAFEDISERRLYMFRHFSHLIQTKM